MLAAKVGFIVYGVHKDGLKDPMGTPFIDDGLIESNKQALRDAGLQLVEYPIVVASKKEARECLYHFKVKEEVDAIILYSGTWVWAAHLIAAVRDYASTGNGILLWNDPGGESWGGSVGGLVLHAAMREIGLNHRFVYAAATESGTIAKISAWCRASAVKRQLNQSTYGVLGGRGMGQTCGVADPSQWMRMFGVDLDSRDTTRLLHLARSVAETEVDQARERIAPLFSEPVPTSDAADRSIRLYLALKKIMAEEEWAGYVIQSFPGLGDDYSATSFPQSMMLEDRVASMTLSDFNSLLTVILLNALSAEPVYYGDLQHINKQTGEMRIVCDGACPPSLAGTVKPAAFSRHGIETEGAAGGLAVQLVCKPGDGVMARVGRRNGEFELVVCRCSMFEPEARVVQGLLEECGIPFWPHAFIKVEADLETLIESWSNEYGCIAYGAHLYEDLIAFGEQAGIRVVAL